MILYSWVVSGGALLECIILIGIAIIGFSSCAWIKQKMNVLTLTKIIFIAGILYCPA